MTASEGMQKAKREYSLQMVTGEGISLHTMRLGKFPNFSVSDFPLSNEIQAPPTPEVFCRPSIPTTVWEREMPGL